MYSIRNRYNLICSQSLETLTLERIYTDEYILANIRVSIALSTGVITLHDTEPSAMTIKLKTILTAIGQWTQSTSWLLRSDVEDHSELYKLTTPKTKSIATISAMRTGESRIKITLSDCTKMCSIVISDISYPHYDLCVNMLNFLESLKTAISSVIEQLEQSTYNPTVGYLLQHQIKD